MSNATFLYNPQSDIAVLSGGAWLNGDVGLENVQNDKYWRVARSVTANPSNTQIRLNMLGNVEIRGFAIVLNNATTSVQVRVSAYSDAGYSSLVYMSPWYSGGQSGDWRDTERSPIIAGDFKQSVIARFWLVEIDDSENPEGYIDVGRLFMGSAFSPSFNYSSDGNSFRFKNNAITATTLAGNTLYWRRINPRQWNGTFPALPEDEIFGSVYDFIRYVGFDREVFIMPDPDDTSHAQTRQFFATIIQQDPFQQYGWDYGTFGFGVEERVAIATATSKNTITPTDRLVIRDFSPIIATSVELTLPTIYSQQQDFAVSVSFGINIAIPEEGLLFVDYPATIATATEIDVVVDSLLIEDFGLLVSGGVDVSTPATYQLQIDYAPNVFVGVNLFPSSDAQIMMDFDPTIGDGIVIEILTASEEKIADYIPSVFTGVSIILPTSGVVIRDYTIAELRGFSGGFNNGFR
jgi:hypothetical protein